MATDEKNAPKHISDDVPILHLYGQYAQHDDAFILGNEKGLRALRDAITRVLEVGEKAATALVFVIDGEGFHPIVARTDADTLDRLHLPYGAEYCHHGKREDIVPTVVSKGDYLKLVKSDEVAGAVVAV